MRIHTGSGPRCIVNPDRALQLWNKTNETLVQIADRFAGVSERNVRDSILRAVESGLGDLARPLPEKTKAAPRRNARSESFRRLPRPDQIAPIPDNVPRCAAFNPEVEEILAKKVDVPEKTHRAAMREVDDMIIEWAQFVMDGGYEEWCGKTPIPWIDAVRIRNILQRHKRKDLWQYLHMAWKTYQKRHEKMTDRQTSATGNGAMKKMLGGYFG